MKKIWANFAIVDLAPPSAVHFVVLPLPGLKLITDQRPADEPYSGTFIES